MGGFFYGNKSVRINAECLLWHNLLCLKKKKNTGGKPRISINTEIMELSAKDYQVAIKNNKLDQYMYRSIIMSII